MAKRKWCAALLALCWSCSATGQDTVKVTGMALDENGAPIAGAVAGAFSRDAFVDTAELLAGAQVRTGTDGIFACPSDGTATTLVVVAPHRQAAVVPLSVRDGEGDRDLGAVVLVPGAQLIGRVRGENGEPLAGARIRVETSIRDWRVHEPRILGGARSDAQGIFKVPGVPRSGLCVVVEADGWLGVSRLCAQESALDVTLRKAARVRGSVVDRDGNPVAGARVSCTTAECQRVPARTSTGPDGTFELGVPPGSRFRLTATEERPPSRKFCSDLLRGAADGVVLRDAAAAAPRAVTVVDAASKEPIAVFRLAALALNPTNEQLVLENGHARLRAYAGRALVPRPQADTAQALLVEADGHGFAVVPAPADAAELVVELGPEATLSGRVVDAVTQQPLAGVAVRALPKGRWSGGTGRAKDLGPRTDSDGRYTIRCLAPGDYGVQAHAEKRPASAVASITLQAGADNRLDLEVPSELWLDFEFHGAEPVPPGTSVRRGGNTSEQLQKPGFFQHDLGGSSTQTLRGGRARLGPLAPGLHAVSLFVPSRTRSGTGTTVQLGEFAPRAEPYRIDLPELRRVIQRGRVDLAGGIPSERAAVLAWPVLKEERGRRLPRPAPDLSPNMDGLDGTGRFALDLPAGDYRLQLADLATGIVFFTAAEDVTVSDTAIELHPEVHWLEVRCAPERAGDPVVLQSFGLTLVGARDGFEPFLYGAYGSAALGGPTRYASAVQFYADENPQRWLVPPGELELCAQQSFDMLKPAVRGYSYRTLGNQTVAIDGREHTATFRIPAPPSDEDLRR